MLLPSSSSQRFRGQGRTVEVNRWLELDGNNIRIVDLELYPTHARLNLEQDPDNAEELQSLDFYLEDKKGNRYEKGSASGLTAMGDSYLFESPYFSDPDSLTLHITKAEWLEKSQKFITVSLKTGEALEPMPGGMEISAIRLDDTTAQVAFLAPMPPASSEICIPEIFQLIHIFSTKDFGNSPYGKKKLSTM